MKDAESLQNELYNEIVGRIKQDDVSYPIKRNGYYYYSRYEEGKEYPVYCRRKDNMENPEQILLDGNEMAKGHHYFDIGAYSVSPDNELLAYSVDTVSRRQYDIFVKNIETGELYAEVIKNTTGNMVWANDNETLFYSVKDESLRSCKIMRHKLNDDPANDELVYFEEDTAFSCYVHGNLLCVCACVCVCVCACACVCVLVSYSYLTLCDPMDCNPSGSSVEGILQTRILEWVLIPFSRGFPQPRV